MARTSRAERHRRRESALALVSQRKGEWLEKWLWYSQMSKVVISCKMLKKPQ